MTQGHPLSAQLAEWHALWQEGQQQYVPVPASPSRNCLPQTDCALLSSHLCCPVGQSSNVVSQHALGAPQLRFYRTTSTCPARRLPCVSDRAVPVIHGPFTNPECMLLESSSTGQAVASNCNTLRRPQLLSIWITVHVTASVVSCTRRSA